MNVKLVTIVLKCALTLLVLITALVVKDIKWKDMNALVRLVNEYIRMYILSACMHASTYRY